MAKKRPLAYRLIVFIPWDLIKLSEEVLFLYQMQYYRFMEVINLVFMKLLIDTAD